MIGKLKIENCGPIDKLEINASPQMNIIIGENDTGKTLILKSLYLLIKTREEFKRGKDQRTFKQVVDDKLTWTFQLDRIGDLVKKGSSGRLRFEATIDNSSTAVAFTASATKGAGEATAANHNRPYNSIFFPAKEVVSLMDVIKKSRNIDQEFGFDDTYLDLVSALEKKPTKGKNWKNFSAARKRLGTLTSNIQLEFDQGLWTFKKGNTIYPVHITAEGIRKIAIIDRLLGNRIITPESVLFFDEPEAVLHPKAIVELMDILLLIMQSGVQVFIATHSFFVIKKLQILSQKNKLQTTVVSLIKNKSPAIYDLKNGMPDNPIIQTSISLYREEIS